MHGRHRRRWLRRWPWGSDGSARRRWPALRRVWPTCRGSDEVRSGQSAEGGKAQKARKGRAGGRRRTSFAPFRCPGGSPRAGDAKSRSSRASGRRGAAVWLLHQLHRPPATPCRPCILAAGCTHGAWRARGASCGRSRDGSRPLRCHRSRSVATGALLWPVNALYRRCPTLRPETMSGNARNIRGRVPFSPPERSRSHLTFRGLPLHKPEAARVLRKERLRGSPPGELSTGQRWCMGDGG